MTATQEKENSFIAFWEKVGHIFHTAAVFVGDLFVKIFGASTAKAFATAAEATLESDLGKIAWTAVQAVQGLATGAEKKAAAFDQIVAAAKSAGISASNSLINMLIEVAVQKLQGQFGPAPAGS